LAFRGRQHRKNQEVSQQVKVQAADRIRMVKMPAEKRPGDNAHTPSAN